MTDTTETGSILDRIVADKREELEKRQRDEPIDALKRRIRELDEQWSLAQAILEGPRGPHAGGKRVQLIAEIQRASPAPGRPCAAWGRVVWRGVVRAAGMARVLSRLRRLLVGHVR